MFGPYHEIVSLGRACQPAHQLRRLLKISRAHVFDWLITTNSGIRTHIADGVADLFVADRLERDEKDIVWDPLTRTKFLHEFPTGTDLATGFAAAAPRLEALIARWRQMMASDAAVLFIRQHDWGPKPADDAGALLATLRAAAPKLRLRLLYLTEPVRTPDLPDQPDLLYRQMPPHPEGHWYGCDEIWEQRLLEALCLDPPQGRD